MLEPDARHRPFARNGRGRDLHDLSDLVNRQAAKEFQLNDARLPAVERRETIQGVVDAEDVVNTARFNGNVIVECYGVQPVATRRVRTACMIDENAPHDIRSNAEKVRPIFPRHSLLAEEAQVGLVDERSGLQRMIAAFAREKTRGQIAQFTVHCARQGFAGVAIAGLREREEFGNA